jgi:cytochrome P450
MPLQSQPDPYPTYAAMREAGRVLKTPIGALIVHRYGDVRHVHGDHERFSMAALAELGGPMSGTGPDGSFLAKTMLTTDPPDHTRLRRVVNRAFTPRSISLIEDRVRAVAGRLLAPATRGEPFDLVAEFAGPLPTIVIAELLGVPPADAARFRVWSESITGTGTGVLDPIAAARDAAEMRRYLLGQIAARQHHGSDDLIGRMVQANDDGSMSDEEVAGACVLLLLAGNETTMRLITNMALAFGRHPDQQQLVSDDHDLIARAVEETLRYDSPVQMLFRAAKAPAEVGGVELRQGSIVLTMLGAANRDPDAFTDPDAFDVARSGDNPHIAFGHGIHFFLGAQLARLEARVAFEEIFERMPTFRVVTADDALVYPATPMLRSPKSLVMQAA